VGRSLSFALAILLASCGGSTTSGVPDAGAGGTGGKSDGSIDCSNVGCAAPPLCSSGCTYKGRMYPAGSTFNATDGCNTCGCDDMGGAACTKKVCVCDPAAEEHRRVYIGKSPADCATVDYTCTGPTTSFSNACGCGCEEDPSCPDWFDCQPSPDVPPCDTAAIKARCPYSGIAF
jgi:hypothetical protein